MPLQVYRFKIGEKTIVFLSSNLKIHCFNAHHPHFVCYQILILLYTHLNPKCSIRFNVLILWSVDFFFIVLPFFHLDFMVFIDLVFVCVLYIQNEFLLEIIPIFKTKTSFRLQFWEENMITNFTWSVFNDSKVILSCCKNRLQKGIEKDKRITYWCLYSII